MLSRLFIRKRQNEKGQALVEFTLMFPIFLAVFIGLMAVSMLFYSYVTMQLAVREGTNAIVKDPQGQTILKPAVGDTVIVTVRKLVRSKSFALDPNALTGTSLGDCLTSIGCILVEPASGWQSGVPVSVYATFSVPLPTVNMVLPGGATLRLGPIPVTAQSVMTIE